MVNCHFKKKNLLVKSIVFASNLNWAVHVFMSGQHVVNKTTFHTKLVDVWQTIGDVNWRPRSQKTVNFYTVFVTLTVTQYLVSANHIPFHHSLPTHISYFNSSLLWIKNDLNSNDDDDWLRHFSYHSSHFSNSPWSLLTNHLYIYMDWGKCKADSNVMRNHHFQECLPIRTGRERCCYKVYTFPI